jgi:hypothetical protein
VGISSKTIIANGMDAPIGMVSFPSTETLQPDWITGQPDVARPQIEIPVADDADKFNAIPDIGVWNLDFWRRDGHNNWRNGSRYHNGCWQRQTNRNTEVNSGIGGQACRAKQGGNEKQFFSFHRFNFYVFHGDRGICRMASMTFTALAGKSCRKNGSFGPDSLTMCVALLLQQAPPRKI